MKIKERLVDLPDLNVTAKRIKKTLPINEPAKLVKPIYYTQYTHTTDLNFYNSGQLSDAEKALYDPKTLTRNLTKEEFEAAMKNNDESATDKGPGYRKIKVLVTK